MKKTLPTSLESPFRFEVEFRTPLGNKIKAMKTWEYRQLRLTIREFLLRFLYKTAVEPGLLRPTFAQAKVKCTYVCTTKRQADQDNLALAFKPWLDELQAVGVLKGDHMDLIGKPEYIREQGEKYMVRIEITQ